MSGTLVADTEDFAQAATMLHQHAAEPLSRALGTVTAKLESCPAMAGSDPGGHAWATSYDRAAREALKAHAAGANGCYRLALLCAQSARNYAQADLASSPSPADRHAITSAVSAVPGPTTLSYWPSLPSAAGGSGGAPTGWGSVQHAVGYVWPNGHQDRLRNAARAWQISAAVVDDAALEANMASVSFGIDRLPESGDMVTVCSGMAAHLEDLASVHRSLADVCEGLARHIDQVHSAVEGELGSLAVQSGLIEGAGAALSFVTFGAAEVPTQAVEAARIATAARRVTELIEGFIEATHSIAASISGHADRAVHVATELTAILEMRATTAPTVQAGRTRSRSLARELSALRRLETKGVLPALHVERSKIENKFKHAKDLGVLVPRSRPGFEAFKAALAAFVLDSATVRVAGRYRKSAAILNYNTKKRVAVVQKPSGDLITIYKLGPEQLKNVVERRSLSWIRITPIAPRPRSASR